MNFTTLLKRVAVTGDNPRQAIGKIGRGAPRAFTRPDTLYGGETEESRE